MDVDETKMEEIRNVVNRHVPRGRDPFLHVDRRKMMVKMIKKIIEQQSIIPNRINLLYLAKSWSEILHSRSQINN